MPVNLKSHDRFDTATTSDPYDMAEMLKTARAGRR